MYEFVSLKSTTEGSVPVPFAGLGHNLALVDEHAKRLRLTAVAVLSPCPILIARSPHYVVPVHGFTLQVRLGRETRGR